VTAQARGSDDTARTPTSLDAAGDEAGREREVGLLLGAISAIGQLA
jgi:hypothetical protein